VQTGLQPVQPAVTALPGQRGRKVAVADAPDAFHSVTLSVDGATYTADLWRANGSQWRLLAVEVHGLPPVQPARKDYPSCQSSLEAAERIAQDVLSDAPAIQAFAQHKERRRT
jgi:hypothetical protein